VITKRYLNLPIPRKWQHYHWTGGFTYWSL